MVSAILVFIIVCVIAANLFLGTLVLLRNSKSLINNVFSWIAFVYALWSVFLLLYEFPIVFSSLFWIKMTYGIINILDVLVLLFSFIFPKPSFNRGRIPAFALAIFYLIFNYWLLLFTPYWIKDVVINTDGQRQTILGGGYLIWVGMTWLVLGVSLSNFLINSRRSVGIRKMQLVYLIYGFVLWGISVNVFDVIIPIVWHNTGYFVLSTITSLCFSSAVAYTILKHRFLDIRFVVARSVAYLLLVIVLGFVYAGGLFVVSTLIIKQPTNYVNLITSTILALIIAFTFQPLRIYLEKVTDKIFFKQRYDTNNLLSHLGGIMASTITLDDLVQLTIGELCSKMHIVHAGMVLLKDGSIFWKKNNNGRGWNYNEEKIELLANDLTANNIGRISVFEEMDESAEKSIMRENNIDVVVTFAINAQMKGALMLGEKSSGDIYSSQDINMLEIIAPEFAVAIRNALSYEEIKRFNVTLKEEVDKATASLEQANVRLKELDHLKDEFVSVASHELRTPMTAIRSYLWMALQGKGGPLTEKQKYYLDRSYNSTVRLIKLVNDMLNVSRIESGRMSFEFGQVDMLKLVDEVIGEVKPKADELGIRINVGALRAMPVQDALMVIADADKIKEVMINLIGNSLKFTPQGGEISIGFSVKDGSVVTSVKDSGQGIEKDDLGRLFQKFGMIKGSYVTNQKASQGTGLGLYISKNIVQKQGGQMWAESEGKGKGAVFSFSLKVFDRAQMEKMTAGYPKEGLGIIHSEI